MSRFRPLDVLPSIKLKLSAIIIGAIAIAALVSTIGFRLGWPVATPVATPDARRPRQLRS